MKPRYLLLTFLILLSFREVAAQITITLQPGPEGKDTYVWSVNPNNNYGNSQALPAMGWTFYGAPGAKRSLMDFDLSDIPPNTIILDARLDLYYNCIEPTYVPQSGNNEAYLQLITTPWDEYDPTWNNQPATTTTDQVYLPRSTEPEQDYTDIDVTVMIEKIHGEPDNYHGMMLRLINEYPYNCLLFASSDWTEKEKRPRLNVTYLECELPTVDFEYDVNGLKVSFTGISNTATTWYWDFGDGYFSNLPDPVHEYQQQGSYEVCLQVSDSCGMAEHCEIVDICDYPVAAFSFSSLDLTVYFENSSIFSDQYFWSFGDGYYSDLADPWHTYDTTGYYYVYLITSNECGADTACQVIYVNYSSIYEQGKAGFSLYPNPAIGQISVNGQQPVAKLMITDLFGRVRDEFENIMAFPLRIDVSAYPEGMFIIHIVTSDYKTRSIKFLKI